MKRKLLDALYLELQSAQQEVNRLGEINTFAMCESCESSAGEARNGAQYTAAKDRVTFADKLITLILDDAA